MNRSKIRELAAKTAARARSIAESAPAGPAEPAGEAKAAAPASSGVVPLKTHQRPALRVLDGDGGTKARKGLTVSRAALSTARSRSRRRPENDPEMAAAALAAFRPYQPAPGVLPNGKKLAMDEVLPGTASWAGGAIIQSGFFADLTFPGYPLLAQWSNQTEYRKVSERLSTEMTRRFMELTSTSDDDKTDLIKEINDWFKEMKVREHAQKLAFVDGTQGRSHLFIDTGDDDPKERAKPIGDGRNKLSLNKVTPKHPIKRLKVVEPTWVYPAKYNSNDPTDPAWLNPETWFVMGTETHRSRLLPFVGREVPDLLKPAFAFGGLSLTQMMKTYVDNWTSTRQHISRLVGNFSRSGIKTDLQQQLAPSDGSAAIEGGSAGDHLMNRIDLYTELADNTGMMVLDKDGEEFFQFNTPLGTLDALQAQALEQVCLPAGMPVVVFLGLTPKGLNASSEGEIQAWEMWVNAYQEHFYGDFIRRMINFAQLCLRGTIDPEIGYKWLPLRTESAVDISTREKAEADRDAIYVDRGVLDRIEVRQKLKADPNSGYNSIDAEDVPEQPEQDDGEGDGPEDTAGKVTGGDDFLDLQEGGDRAVLPFVGDEASFEEGKHPRDSDGKFAKGTGGAGGPAKAKKTAFGGLYKTGATEKEAHENTLKSVLANKKPVAGSSYRQMLAHLIKEAPKHGTEQHVPALKEKLGAMLALAAEKLTDQAYHKDTSPADAAKFQAMAKKAMEQAKELGFEGEASTEAKPQASSSGGMLDPTMLQKVSGKKGSNPGGVYKDGSGDEFYVKHLKSEDHKKSEYTAASLYKLAGVQTLDYVPATGANVATKYVPLGKTNVSQLSPPEKMLAQRDFAVHAWLANWDAVGTGGDNVGVVDGDSTPVVLDVGGSLGFRAQGEPKPFGPAVPELGTMVDKQKSPDAAALYAGMSKTDKIKSAWKVAMVHDGDIRKAVKANGGADALAETLIARKFNLATEFGLKVIEEQEDPEFASKHPRNPDGTFKSSGKQDEPAAAAPPKQEEQPKADLPKPTESELSKAKKPQALQPQYVPGYGDLTTGTYQGQAQHAIKAFNDKYEGKTLTDPDALAQKVADFKNLGTQVELLKQEEAGSKAKIVAEEKAKAAESAKAAKAKADAEAKAAADKNAAVMKDLGITDQQALGFNALVNMLGGKQADVVKAFKKYEDEAKGYGYPITGFQAAMIKNYTDGGYRQINENLRKGAWTEAEHVYVTMMNKALRAMPTYKGTLYRGATLSLDQQKKYAEAGKVAREDAFMSTSISSPFGGNTKFVVTAIGKHGAHVKKLSLHKSEDEVVFAANTYFKITKVEGKPGGQMTVHIEEMEE